MDYGYVVGTFIHPLGAPAPTDRGLSGTVRFIPHDARRLASPSREAGRVSEILHMDQDGHVAGWLVTGVYTVSVTWADGAKRPVFDIRVEATHTESAPLDLVLAAPPIPSPEVVVIVSEEERIRAEAAADRAEAAAAEIDVALDPAVVGGSTATGHLVLTKHDGSEADAGPVGQAPFHVYQASDLTNVTAAGPAIFHYNPATTMNPPLPTDHGLLPFPGDYPGEILLVDYDAVIPGVKLALGLFPYFRNSTTPTYMTATAYINYTDAPPFWSFQTSGFPVATMQDTLIAYDASSHSWVARYLGNLNALVYKDVNNQINVPSNPTPGGPGLFNAPSTYYLRRSLGIAPINTLLAGSQPSPITFQWDQAANNDSTQVYRVTMNANLNVAFNPPTVDGYTQICRVILYLQQDATGGRTLTMPAGVKRAANFALSTAPNATDVVTFTWNGSYIYATIDRDSQGLATSAATAGAVMQRDSAGRSQVATPSAATDIATKGYVDTADALKAPLASPSFTGTPVAPTATAGTNTTQLATTAFVAAAIAAANAAWVAVPATATSAGTAGQRAYDANFLYICVATNTWRRVALAAW